ncbi:hypothetical protein AVEN_104474-1 [Araneus ventricosus]|uniref:Uncharacterized protein n=1 Tax=Araneus ventricosus TaxID=182803 RepID=A0A4Y2IJ07_ARAVE|nr:hypothetical protein AVEN_104474-1 [Araneus ventricosus]
MEFILDLHSCRILTGYVCLNVDFRPNVDKQVPRKVLAVLPAGAHALSGLLELVNRSSEGSRISIPRSALHSDTRLVFGGIRQLTPWLSTQVARESIVVLDRVQGSLDRPHAR